MCYSVADQGWHRPETHFDCLREKCKRKKHSKIQKYLFLLTFIKKNYYTKYLNCFNNPHVSSQISRQLEVLEIKVHESMEMVEWNDGKWRPGQLLNKIHFASTNSKQNNSLTVNCCVSHLLKTN